VSDSFGSPGEIGELFLTDHLLAFEITSIVLLIAAIGGVVLGAAREGEEKDVGARHASPLHGEPDKGRT
jgi:NADH-quinone oxidoreductase subunit J/NAD(P)H-quinone oxidoreductase subunit 6